MPTPKPRTRRQGVYAEPGSVRPEWSAQAYRWRCPECPCETNLRGLLREECSYCGHRHFPDVPQKEPTHAD